MRQTGAAGRDDLGGYPRRRAILNPVYGPFWEAAQQLEMPLTLHIITERNRGPAQAQTTGFASILKSNMRGIQESSVRSAQ